MEGRISQTPTPRHRRTSRECKAFSVGCYVPVGGVGVRTEVGRGGGGLDMPIGKADSRRGAGYFYVTTASTLHLRRVPSS